MTKLSILIPTVVGRESFYDKLNAELERQKAGLDCIEIIGAKDNKEIPIGTKREGLYFVASGLYSVQLDDDDMIPPFYIERVLKAIELGTDCIGYNESVVWNGVNMGISNISLRNRKWDENKHGYRYVRTPFFKVPIKTEIARSVNFQPIRFGEDYEWSMRLYPNLKTEVFIPETMYLYSYVQGDNKTKYGIK